jgi:hypothetical protein
MADSFLDKLIDEAKEATKSLKDVEAQATKTASSLKSSMWGTASKVGSYGAFAAAPLYMGAFGGSSLEGHREVSEGMLQFQGIGKAASFAGRRYSEAEGVAGRIGSGLKKIGNIFDKSVFQQYISGLQELEKVGTKTASSLVAAFRPLSLIFSTPVIAANIAYGQLDAYHTKAMQAKKDFDEIIKSVEGLSKGAGISATMGLSGRLGVSGRRAGAAVRDLGYAGYKEDEILAATSAVAAIARKQGISIEQATKQLIEESGDDTLAMSSSQRASYFRQKMIRSGGLAYAVRQPTPSVGRAIEQAGIGAQQFSTGIGMATNALAYQLIGSDPLKPDVISRGSAQVKALSSRMYDSIKSDIMTGITAIVKAPGTAMGATGKFLASQNLDLARQRLSGRHYFDYGNKTDFTGSQKFVRGLFEKIIGRELPRADDPKKIPLTDTQAMEQVVLGETAEKDTERQKNLEKIAKLAHEREKLEARKDYKELQDKSQSFSRWAGVYAKKAAYAKQTGDEQGYKNAYREYLKYSRKAKDVNEELKDNPGTDWDFEGVSGSSLMKFGAGPLGPFAFLGVRFKKDTRTPKQIDEALEINYKQYKERVDKERKEIEERRKDVAAGETKYTPAALQEYEDKMEATTGKRVAEMEEAIVLSKRDLKEKQVEKALKLTRKESTKEIDESIKLAKKDLEEEEKRLSKLTSNLDPTITNRLVEQSKALSSSGIKIAIKEAQVAGILSTEDQKNIDVLSGGTDVLSSLGQKHITSILSMAQQRYSQDLRSRISEVHRKNRPEIGKLLLSQAAGMGIETGDIAGAMTGSNQELQNQADQILNIRKQMFQKELAFTVQYTEARINVIKNHYDTSIMLEQGKLEAGSRKLGPAFGFAHDIYNTNQVRTQTGASVFGAYENLMNEQRTGRDLQEQGLDVAMAMVGGQVPVPIQRMRMMRRYQEAVARHERTVKFEDRFAKSQTGGIYDVFNQLEKQGVSSQEFLATPEGREMTLGMYQQALPSFIRQGKGDHAVGMIGALADKQRGFAGRKLVTANRIRGMEAKSIVEQISEMEKTFEELGKKFGRKLFDTPEGRLASIGLASKYQEAAQTFNQLGQPEKAEMYAKKYQEHLANVPGDLKSQYGKDLAVTNGILREQLLILKAIKASLTKASGGIPREDAQKTLEGADKKKEEIETAHKKEMEEAGKEKNPDTRTRMERTAENLKNEKLKKLEEEKEKAKKALSGQSPYDVAMGEHEEKLKSAEEKFRKKLDLVGYDKKASQEALDEYKKEIEGIDKDKPDESKFSKDKYEAQSTKPEGFLKKLKRMMGSKAPIDKNPSAVPEPIKESVGKENSDSSAPQSNSPTGRETIEERIKRREPYQLSQPTTSLFREKGGEVISEAIGQNWGFTGTLNVDPNKPVNFSMPGVNAIPLTDEEESDWRKTRKYLGNKASKEAKEQKFYSDAQIGVYDKNTASNDYKRFQSGEKGARETLSSNFFFGEQSMDDFMKTKRQAGLVTDDLNDTPGTIDEIKAEGRARGEASVNDIMTRHRQRMQSIESGSDEYMEDEMSAQKSSIVKSNPETTVSGAGKSGTGDKFGTSVDKFGTFVDGLGKTKIEVVVKGNGTASTRGNGAEYPTPYEG